MQIFLFCKSSALCTTGRCWLPIDAPFLVEIFGNSPALLWIIVILDHCMQHYLVPWKCFSVKGNGHCSKICVDSTPSIVWSRTRIFVGPPLDILAHTSTFMACFSVGFRTHSFPILTLIVCILHLCGVFFYVFKCYLCMYSCAPTCGLHLGMC